MRGIIILPLLLDLPAPSQTKVTTPIRVISADNIFILLIWIGHNLYFQKFYERSGAVVSVLGS